MYLHFSAVNIHVHCVWVSLVVELFRNYQKPPETTANHRPTHLLAGAWLEVLAQHPQREAEGVPDFVAKVSVADDPLDVEVDVPALGRVGAECKAHGVRATLRDALWVVGFLVVEVGEGKGKGRWRKKEGREEETRLVYIYMQREGGCGGREERGGGEVKK